MDDKLNSPKLQYRIDNKIKVKLVSSSAEGSYLFWEQDGIVGYGEIRLPIGNWRRVSHIDGIYTVQLIGGL